MTTTGLTFLHGSHTPRCPSRVDKHFEGYCSLQYLTAGEVELFYDARRHVLRDEAMWFCFPGPHIRFHAAGPEGWWEHRYVAFRGPLADRWRAAGLIAAEPPRLPEGHDYLTRFDRMLALAFRKDRWGPLRATNLLEGILLELAEASKDRLAAGEPWLLRAQEAMSDAERYPPDYAALAGECGMALSTLRRRFRGQTGLSLQQYALKARNARACELLVETDLPLKAIAERLGYRDVYFFSRQFHRLAGLPPARFRRSRSA